MYYINLFFEFVNESGMVELPNDLVTLFGLSTGRYNEQVKRNQE